MRPLVLLTGALVASCAADLDTGLAEPFTSDDELERYLAAIPDPAPRPFWEANVAPTASPQAVAAPSAGNESITNVQEAGVDEGGIVKNVGSFLVFLRRGQLVVVDVSKPGQPERRSITEVPADPLLRSNVWYDELLVQGRELVVVGYRYGLEVGNGLRGATELNRFTLLDDGTLTRGKTVFFESWDYFSGHNYASRLVGGQLVFYMPVPAFSGQGLGRTVQLPRQLIWNGATRFSLGAAMVSGASVTRPPVRPATSSEAVFHTVMRCSMELDCTGQSVLAGYSREFYVSPQAIYLSLPKVVYRIGLSDGAVGLHAVEGQPIDQFSFRERGSELEVVTLAQRGGSSVALVSRLAVAGFDAAGRQQTASTVVSTITGSPSSSAAWFSRNRFVDDFLYLARAGDSAGLVVHHLPSGAQQTHAVEHVTRLEPLAGVGALAVSSDWRSSTLTLQPFAHAGASSSAATPVTLPGTAEGETRSHGFFFKPSAQGGGRFGLPVTAQSRGWWGNGASNIAFFDVTPAAGVTLTASVSSTATVGSSCVSSCVDWYGNTRPIFLQERLFALMGDELKEVDGASVGLPVVARVALDTP